jgi:ABC-type multidrug transport system fused ATPase/permease subunit
MANDNSDTSSFSETKTFRLVLQLLSTKEKRKLSFVLVLMAIGSVFEVLSLGMVVPVIGLLTKPNYAGSFPIFENVFGDISQERFVVIAMSAILIIFLLKTFFFIWKVWVQSGFSSEVSTRVSRELYGIYLRQPYSYHLETNSSTLVRNSLSGTTFIEGLLNPLLYLTSESFVTLGLVLTMLLLEPVGTFATLFVFAVGAWTYKKATSKRISRWGEADISHKGFLIQQLQQGFGGIRDVKMLRRENFFIDKFNGHLHGSALVSRKFAVVQAIPRYILELLTIICFTVLVTVSIVFGNGLDEVMPVIGLFGVAAFRILPATYQIIGNLQSVNRSKPVLSYLTKDFALIVEPIEPTEHSVLEFSEIEIHKLKFSYSGTQSDALADISLVIKRGDAVGIVGQSGSGKSTIVDVVLGFLKPQEGSVMVNGIDIGSNLQWWRSKVGYVPQSIFLTDDTLRRNIAFGLADEQIDELAVRTALRLAQLEEFVSTLPDGPSTMVGERGVRLSGGQRQRIGIARALYNNPEVLVLDEATSSLDTETEHGVMQAVQALQGDKTVIIVAHRLSTVEYCDRLYRLDAGRIVDEGTFDEVMNRSQS